jgi:hypothetical protein
MPIFTLFVPTLTDAHLHAGAAEGTTVLQKRASSVCGMGSRLRWRWSEEVENSASATFKEQVLSRLVPVVFSSKWSINSKLV